eukprot:PhF_6_TR40333/c1_g1_i1/m.59969
MILHTHWMLKRKTNRLKQNQNQNALNLKPLIPQRICILRPTSLRNNTRVLLRNDRPQRHRQRMTIAMNKWKEQRVRKTRTILNIHKKKVKSLFRKKPKNSQLPEMKRPKGKHPSNLKEPQKESHKRKHQKLKENETRKNKTNLKKQLSA